MKLQRVTKYILLLGIAGSIAAGSLLIGNGIVVHGEEYEYDALNRVIKVIYDDGGYVEYSYDNNGNIVKTTVHPASSQEPEESKPSTGSGEPKEPGKSEPSTGSGGSGASGKSEPSTEPEESGEPTGPEHAIKPEKPRPSVETQTPEEPEYSTESKDTGNAIDSESIAESEEFDMDAESGPSTDSQADPNTTQNGGWGIFDLPVRIFNWIISKIKGIINWIIGIFS